MRAAVFPALALLAVAPVAGAQAAELPIDEARVVQLALEDSPVVDAARSAHDAARAGRDAAQLSRLPDLTVSGRYTRLSSIPERFRSFDGLVFPQLLNNLGARAQLRIPISEAFLNLAATARAAGHEAEAARVEVTAAKAQLAFDVRVAFLDYWSRSLAVTNADELVRAAESNAVDQRSREAAGTVAHNDVLTFENQLDAAIMQQRAAVGDRDAAEATLRAFFPRYHASKLVVSALPTDADRRAPVVGPAPATPPPVAAAEARVAAADARHTSESLSRLPKLMLSAAGDYAAPSPHEHAALVR